jgi:hypothetical protein
MISHPKINTWRTVMKISKLLFAVLAAVALLGTAAQADVKKGTKLYLKKLKKPCNMSGAKFAASHTQAEWSELKESGKLADAILEMCPKAKVNDKFKTKYLPHIYDFAHEYASDSGNVPSCG